MNINKLTHITVLNMITKLPQLTKTTKLSKVICLLDVQHKSIWLYIKTNVRIL